MIDSRHALARRVLKMNSCHCSRCAVGRGCDRKSHAANAVRISRGSRKSTPERELLHRRRDVEAVAASAAVGEESSI